MHNRMADDDEKKTKRACWHACMQRVNNEATTTRRRACARNDFNECSISCVSSHVDCVFCLFVLFSSLFALCCVLMLWCLLLVWSCCASFRSHSFVLICVSACCCWHCILVPPACMYVWCARCACHAYVKASIQRRLFSSVVRAFAL
jgi:hypothetical protein